MRLPGWRPIAIAYAVACIALSVISARVAHADESYPNRTVRFIIPYPPGGPADTVARLIAQSLTERLGQPVIVESKSGAGANIGTEYVVRSAPDGYTLLFISTANAINASLYKNLSFNFMRDMRGVAGLQRVPIVLVVNPSVPARTVPEFLAYARNNPGKVTFASPGAGTSNHLAGEIFKARTKADLTHVPYRGAAPVITDLIGGQVHSFFDNVTNSLEHIRAGNLRALAIASSKPSDLLPGVPTFADSVAGYEAGSLYGVGVPAQTPPAIIAKLNAAINAALADPRVKARLTETGGMTLGGTSEEFQAMLAAETEKWAGALAAAGLQPTQ